MALTQTIPTRLAALARSVAYQNGSWNDMMSTWQKNGPKFITVQLFAFLLLEYAFDLRDRRPDPVLAGEIVEKLRELAQVLRADIPRPPAPKEWELSRAADELAYALERPSLMEAAE